MAGIDFNFISVTGAISTATLIFANYAVRATSHGYRIDQEKVRDLCETTQELAPRSLSVKAKRAAIETAL